MVFGDVGVEGRIGMRYQGAAMRLPGLSNL